MTDITRVALFGKLDPLAYKAIESATVFCKLRGNPYVELSHWMNQILQLADSDLHHIVREFGLDPSRLARDLTQALDQLPRGATSISDLSSHLDEVVERAWSYASLMFAESRVRVGHLVVGMLKTSSLRLTLFAMSREFEKIKPDILTERFAEIVQGSPEQGMAGEGSNAAPGEASAAMPPAPLGKQEALRRYSVDLTERARQGEMDPIVGRDQEIRQVIDILMRRRQNNPILTGEAGVGKTAVVEGLAQLLAKGDVPPALQGVSLRCLDIGLLQAGASMKGEFENRLRQVIDEVQASSQPIILFIDEAHTLIGAGGTAGTGDAANLLKPALARGKLRTIAATTWAEYKRHIEKDPALTRRFQVVQVGEPSEDKAILMMRATASVLEKHHEVLILDEALAAAVKLSHRYIPGRQLPDKAVSLLDTACARVACSQHAVPAAIDDCRRRLQGLETELQIVRREVALGIAGAEKREGPVLEGLQGEKERLSTLEARWAKEKKLVGCILDLRAKLRTTAETSERPGWLADLQKAQSELERLQGDRPLILPTVDEQAVAQVVGDWTGIPVGRMVKNEIETVMRLASTLGQRVMGQDHALEMIARRIQTSRAGLENPHKPIGVFLLAGPSGVGKTETALALAEILYGGEQNVITINMSEFQEAHTVSTLKGSPPGYVGYGEGGVLTEAVRRRPYSVVLLDEVEKAHPDVHELFFQVFDKGWMEDGEGRVIDFRNTVILLTTNVGSELIARLAGDPTKRPASDDLAQALRGPLLRTFPAALLGRMVTIPYYALSDEMIGNIACLQLGRVSKRLQESHGLPFSYDDDVVRLIVSRCTEVESGGRMIDAILTNTLLPRISQELLTRMLRGKVATCVNVSVDKNEFSYGFDDSAETPLMALG
jgi:type VI secretion system protein VasG